MSRPGFRDSTSSLQATHNMHPTLAKQKSVLHAVPAADPKAQNKEKILVVLTRLNDKATQRGAAEELAAIVRGLDADSVSVLVNNICNTGAWEPKPFAKKEGVHALSLLFSDTCPVRDLALQQYLGKLLAHIKKCMQDTDGAVRDACSDALVAAARALSEHTGALLPGSTSCPVVKVVFDGLAEQKRESQQTAAQALLQMSPVLAPLSKELVKVLLRMLKSSTFQGTAALLSAVACTSPDSHQPAGLLKDGTEAFLPYLSHIIGQPASGTAPGSGILGCLAHKDWAVRKAAGDTLKAAVIVLGPQIEPEGVWDVDSPASLTGRCLQGLEGAKFDKVREARDVTRDAAVAVAELQRYVAEGGQQGGWQAHCAHVLGTALPPGGPPLAPLTITPVTHSSPGKLTGRLSPASVGRSPVNETFRRAAATQDVLVSEPKPRPGSAVPPAADGEAVDDSHVDVDASADAGLIAAVHSSSNGGSNTDGRSAIRPSSRSSSGRSNSSRRRATTERSEAAAADDAAAAPAVTDANWSAEATFGAAGGTGAAVADAELAVADEASVSQVEPQWSVHEQQPVSAEGIAAAQYDGAAGALGRDEPLAPDGGLADAAADLKLDFAAGSAHGLSGAATTSALSLDLMEDFSTSHLQPMPSLSPRRRSGSKQQQQEGGQQQQQQQQQRQQQGEQALAPSSSARDGWQAPVRSSSGRPASASVLSPSSSRRAMAAGADASGPSLLVPKAEWDATRRQLAELRQGHELLASLLQELSHSSAASIAALQDRVALLEGQLLRRSSHVTPRPEQRSRLSDAQAGASSAPAEAATSSAAVAAPQPQTPSDAPVADAGRVRRAMSGVSRSMDWAASGMGVGPGLANGSSGFGAAGVTSSLSALPGRVPDDSNATPSPHTSAATPSTPTAATAATTTPIAAPSTPSSYPPGDLEAAFVDALQSPKGDMQLLRLIQKTGPVWGQLSTPTALQLLEAFTKSVSQGVMLHRILPWLWRLGDEGAGGPVVPGELQRRLLGALVSSPGAEDEQVQEKVQLLVDTLRAVWSLPADHATA